ncbi:acetyl-CoA synthetase [Albimonas donghaensis]|uniref:Acetyl-CoA synthetase n=1 Tax=Albimonas donghaensis TaxID=356660 RepID=A0A1H3BG47_9RHOB|nr:acetate--CoA ligase family protein [Albimonas donghaensis]SDX40913.1 acetyl-CoA synthetase [Albimonas donghaensis]
MSAGGRLYRGEEMKRLLAPRSIAIVGISQREGSFGQRTYENLGEFQGDIYFVNPRYEELMGRKCYPSIASLPEAPDCVVLVTAREAIGPLLEECIAKGCGGVMIYASGFAEMGGDNAELQRRNARMAHDAGMPIIGPNAIGFVNFSIGAGVTFMFGMDFEETYARPAAERRVGLVTQSGALGLALHQSAKHGHHLSHMLACGNSSDVDVSDCISYLAEDPVCKAIAAVIEGVPDGARLEAAIKKAHAAGKPVVVSKVARGEAGAAAAASHTGSLAGSHEAYRSMVMRAGGVFVDEIEGLIDTAQFLAKARPPVEGAEGVAIIATSGGAGVVLTDAAEDAGIPLPQPNAEVRAVLESKIPEYGSAANPVDVTAQVINDRQSLVDCINAMLGQKEYGLMLVPHPNVTVPSIDRMKLMNELAGQAGKIIAVPWLSGWLEGPAAVDVASADNLAVFRSARHCMTAISEWMRIHAQKVEPVDKPRLTTPSEGLAQALAAAGGQPVTEREAKAILSGYGVPVIEEKPAASAEAAADMAAALGFPVVMKIDSPDLPHKTEAGGIALNLKSAEAVKDAYAAMMTRVKAYKADARIEGVLIQRMAPAGVEIVVGARRDPTFGAVIVVGLGGVMVELMRDSVAAPAPVTPHEASEMLARLRGAAVLDGFRDLPPVDKAKLAEVVARVSEFAADAGAGLAELDVNPLICRGDDIVAVDALIIPGAGED